MITNNLQTSTLLHALLNVARPARSHTPAGKQWPRGYRLLLLLTFLGLIPVLTYAQYKVEVPSEISFANMKLELSNEARKKVQTDVDALTRYEKYFNAKVERIDAYFPLIEEVLREERVPDDVKYLVIQESALVGDAVSSSNAVGYWQFKQASAEEVGLTINRSVDERMNIVAATRGAARYLKSNNAHFDNWLYALMAYYEGPGGALKKADKAHNGARKMRLKGDTHWYVLKYLSHKVAFEQAIGRNPTPSVQLITYSDGAGRTLAEIAREFEVSEADLTPYNKWLKQNRIPEDKLYHVIVPRYDRPPVEAPIAQEIEREPLSGKAASRPASASNQSINNPTYFAERDNTDEFPVVERGDFRGNANVRVNGIPGIVAKKGEDVSALARRSGISSSQLVRYNDLTSQQATIQPGEAYYLKPKRNRALAHYHTVAPGENLWSISQRLGIKMKKLMRDNRMREEEVLKPGRVLWARFIRPEHVEVTYRDVPPPAQAAPPLAHQEEIVAPPPLASQQEAQTSTGRSIDSSEIVEEESSVSLTTEEDTSPPEVAVSSEDPKGLNDVEEDAVWRAEAIPEQHTVAPGETLFSIARQYQISPKQLAAYNNLTFGDPLAVGQQLRTSAGDQTNKETMVASDNTVLHEVQSGETMFQIARNYGVTIKELMEWNHKNSFNLNVGERLKILE